MVQVAGSSALYMQFDNASTRFPLVPEVKDSGSNTKKAALDERPDIH